MVNINSLERDGLRQAELCPRNTMMMNINNTLIPDRSQLGITMTRLLLDTGTLVTSMPLVYQRSRKLEVGRTSLLEYGI